MSIFRLSRPLRRSCSLRGVTVYVAALVLSSIGRGQSEAILNTTVEAGGAGSNQLLLNSSSVPDVQMGLVLGPDGNFYGTVDKGGSNSCGFFYSLTPQGVVTVLHNFVAVVGNLDGSVPNGGLILGSDGCFYGTTQGGGTGGEGTFYRVTLQGQVTILHNFSTAQAPIDGSSGTVADGMTPVAGVIQGSDGSFYGTTTTGGAHGTGTVFKMTAQGAYTILHSFQDGTVTNDASAPTTGLVLDANGNLFGASPLGGSNGTGAIYEINAQGQASVLYSFAAPSYVFTIGTSSTTRSLGGYSPNSSLALGADGNLYGTAVGAAYGGGAVYQITPQGQLTFIHYFGDGSVAADGAETAVGGNRLTLGSDQNFYGTTAAGGAAGKGTVFKITTAGVVTILHSFGDGTRDFDGNQPRNGVIFGSNGQLVGTTAGGGQNQIGTAFSIDLFGAELTSPLHITALPGQTISYPITTTRNVTQYAAETMPAGFSFDSVHGIISGTAPATPGTVDIVFSAVNDDGGGLYTLVITVESTPVISSLLNVVGSTTAGLTYQVRATQGATGFTATGLPPGVAIDPATGMLFGTPTATGTFPVTVSATNGVGTGTATVTMQILGTAPTASQEYTLIHSFADGSVIGEGTFPGAMILGNDATLYGVTAEGGTNGVGTVFNLSPAGNASVVANLGGVNGAQPQGLCAATDGTLYGTAATGGSANVGTIFKIAPDGTFTLLHTFGVTTNDGATPQGGLVLANDGNYYGTTQFGGSAHLGTVYQMTPAGVVTVIHSFGDGSVTNDGAQPVAALIVPASGAILTPAGVLTSGTVALLGTTLQGGANGDGTAFAISGTGTVQIMHSFGDPAITAGDGQLPRAALTATTVGVYGTTATGGSAGKGTLFMLYGTVLGYSIVHNFGDGSVADDGQNPNSAMVTSLGSVSLVPASGYLYGTTQNGGVNRAGAVFSCALSETGSSLAATVNGAVSIVHSFDDPTVTPDGTIPQGGLCFGADHNLYGTTMGGGAGSGTAFGLQVSQGNVSWTGSIPISAVLDYFATGTLPPGMTIDPTTGALLGLPSVSARGGIYSFSVISFFNGIPTTTQTLSVKVNQTFAAWANLHAVSSVVTSGSSGTPADGVSMALKYLFDASNPGQPMTMADHAAMPAMGVDNTSFPGTPYVALTYRQYAGMTGMEVGLESSDDMVNWSPVTGSDLLQKQTGTDSTTGDPMMEMGAPMDGSGHQFLRLKVTPQ